MLNCLVQPPELQTNAQNNHQQGHRFKIKFYNNYAVIQRQELFFVHGVLNLKQQCQEIIFIIIILIPHICEAVMEMQLTIYSICFPSGQIRGFPQHCNVFYL